MNRQVLISIFLTIACSVGVTQVANSASFDCSKATSVVDKIICTDRSVSDLDDQLSLTYKTVLSAETEKEALKADQRRWLKEQRNQCKDESCLVQVYKERIAVLAKRLPTTEGQSASIKCTEKKTMTRDSEDPIITKTCTYKNYKSISTGEPDYKGRYTYAYELLKKQGNRYEKVSNSTLFNKKQDQLLAQLNLMIAKEYEDYRKYPDNRDCLEGMTRKKFSLEDMGIEFGDGKIEFNVTLGLPSVCMNVDGVTVTLPIDQIVPYLNE